ncbi:MAG: unnamed protein product [Candidatus Burkholderia crenata]|nr:MAG: unnamed protein product [Candidatus Burkholderia crenata]
MPIAYFDQLGLPRLITSTFRTARYGPACRVVWQGYGLMVVPYADLFSVFWTQKHVSPKLQCKPQVTYQENLPEPCLTG